MNQPTAISNRVLIAGVLCFGLIDAFIVGNAWLVPPAWTLVLMSIPVAQCVLVAAWAGISRANLGLRFGMPFLTMWTSWKIVQHVLALPLESMVVTRWMLVLAWVLVIVLAGARAKRVLGEADRWDVFWKNYVRIDLKSMMMLTLAAGLAFAFMQYGRVHWRWSVEAIDAKELLTFNLLGVFTGLQALACLWFLFARPARRQFYRGGLHLAYSGASGFAFSYLVTPGNWSASLSEALTLWLSGNAIVVSLVMLGRWLSPNSGQSSQCETRVTSI